MVRRRLSINLFFLALGIAIFSTNYFPTTTYSCLEWHDNPDFPFFILDGGVDYAGYYCPFTTTPISQSNDVRYLLNTPVGGYIPAKDVSINMAEKLFFPRGICLNSSGQSPPSPDSFYFPDFRDAQGKVYKCFLK